MNRDLIDRAELPDVRIEIPKRLDDETCRIISGLVQAFQTVIKSAPTVDAVEVVRCKDCLNAMKITESDRERWPVREDALQCGLIGHVVLPDDYCSGGVKADAEVEGC